MTSAQVWSLLLFWGLPWTLSFAIGLRVAYDAGTVRERLRWMRRVATASQNPDRARGMLALLDETIDVAERGWLRRARRIAPTNKGLN